MVGIKVTRISCFSKHNCGGTGMFCATEVKLPQKSGHFLFWGVFHLGDG